MQIDAELARNIVSLIDLTSLNESDTDETIDALCNKAISHAGHVAAVCVYPQFVQQAATLLANSAVRVATVANFPAANDPLETVIESIKQSIKQGADEIDVVFPYRRYLAGDRAGACDFISACKKVCGAEILLKVILETGELKTSAIIADVSQAAISAGADFLKTSTGKVAVGATLEAATVMLQEIKKSDRLVGFKASGGVRTLEQALAYLYLASDIMGSEWITPRSFRFGASQLLDEIQKNLPSLS